MTLNNFKGHLQNQIFPINAFQQGQHFNSLPNMVNKYQAGIKYPDRDRFAFLGYLTKL